MARALSLAVFVVASLLAIAAVAVARDAPETTITAGPIGRTGDSSPSFAFESSDAGATFECSLDGSGFSTCTSPKAYAGVTESPHTFAVRSTNAAGETDPTPAQRDFIADGSVEATISAARDQVLEDGHIQVAIRILASERLRAAVRGTIELERSSFDLQPTHQHVDVGRTVVRLRPTARDASAITKALAHGGKVKARVRVALADAVGNELSVPVAVRLRSAADHRLEPLDDVEIADGNGSGEH